MRLALAAAAAAVLAAAWGASEAQAQAGGAPADFLVVTTDSSAYTKGGTVTVTVEVNRVNTQPYGISVRIMDPDGSLVDVKQINADRANRSALFSEGDSRTAEFKTGGPTWAKSGQYTVAVNYGIESATAEFGFVSEDPATPIVEPLEEPKPVEPKPEPVEPKPAEPKPVEPKPAEPECGPGHIERNGECVSICAEGTQFVDGKCEPICGDGTKWVDGKCVVDEAGQPAPAPGGGCLIATAAYGSELEPQVQFLREVRDGTLMGTSSGASFMSSFSSVYYSFSPAVADLERQSPAFRAAVQAAITPMLYSLSIMSLAEGGSESGVLALGVSVIALNIGMYVAAPAGAAVAVRRLASSRSR